MTAAALTIGKLIAAGRQEGTARNGARSPMRFALKVFGYGVLAVLVTLALAMVWWQFTD